MLKGLYVNHKKQQCGVYEFGREIGELLLTSKKYKFHYCECDSLDELKTNCNKIHPDVIIYNYHPATMGWVHIKEGRWHVPLVSRFQAVHVGAIHEVYQQAADQANNKVFDFHIAPDPTLLLKNPLVYKTGRLLPKKAEYVKDKNQIPVIGSFGFAMPNKGFEKIVSLVQNEFDEAIIRLNIPFAKFGDEDGTKARQVAAECKKTLTKDSIKLEINHDFLDKENLLDFLSSNTINVFLYGDQENRGISSVTDWALAAGRPIAISKSRLFRHLFNCRPSICVEDNSLKAIMENGIDPIKRFWSEYSPDTLLWDYERIVGNILAQKNKSFRSNRTIPKFFFKKVLRKAGLVKEAPPIQHNVWTKLDDGFEFPQKGFMAGDFKPIDLPPGTPLNRILDNLAREQYRPVIDFLFKNLSRLMAKKIPEANIQQAFVLDSAVRLSKHFEQPKILAVGSFEDTAVEGLKKLDYQIDDIDPILNYDLGTFLTKPYVKPETYDIIISTSVIEHVQNDEQFVKDIAHLLKKGGYAILTCDYKDQYKPGDDIPEVDFRFYTQKDIKERLMKAIPNCHLADEPIWDCENPDFYLVDRYNYTFASIVFRKNL